MSCSMSAIVVIIVTVIVISTAGGCGVWWWFLMGVQDLLSVVGDRLIINTLIKFLECLPVCASAAACSMSECV